MYILVDLINPHKDLKGTVANGRSELNQKGENKFEYKILT